MGEIAARLGGVDLTALPAVDLKGLRIGPPISQPRNIWCIGLNYSDHAAEAGLPSRPSRSLFNKSSATYCGPERPDPVFPPDDQAGLGG